MLVPGCCSQLAETTALHLWLFSITREIAMQQSDIFNKPFSAPIEWSDLVVSLHPRLHLVQKREETLGPTPKGLCLFWPNCWFGPSGCKSLASSDSCTYRVWLQSSESASPAISFSTSSSHYLSGSYPIQAACSGSDPLELNTKVTLVCRTSFTPSCAPSVWKRIPVH